MNVGVATAVDRLWIALGQARIRKIVPRFVNKIIIKNQHVTESFENKY